LAQALISRRRLIAGSVIIAAALSAGGAAWFLNLEDAAPSAQALSQRELLWVSALGMALFPLGNPIGPSFDDVDGAMRVDTLLAEFLLPKAATPLRYVLKSLDIGARLSLGASLLELDPGARLQLLLDWSKQENVARRASMDGLKSVLAIAYFDVPEVQDAIGFSSRCHVRETL
jgi:hypothetical protein